MKCEQLLAGLSIHAITNIKAFRVSFRNEYHEAHNDSPIAYTGSSSGAVYQWMSRFNAARDEFLYYCRQTRVHRAPEFDLVRWQPGDNDEGRLLAQMLDSMGVGEKISLLQFGGVNVAEASTPNIQRRLLRVSRKRQDAVYDSAADHLLSNGVGRVTTSPDGMLFTRIPEGTRLIEKIPFSHYSAWRYEGLTPLGIQLFLLVLQEWFHDYHVIFSRQQLEMMVCLLEDAKDLTYQDKRPQIFHKLFKDPIDKLPQQMTYIYSGEHGLYWLSTSGYSQNSRDCTKYPLCESLGMTDHCCKRKRIFIEFVNEDL